ncbi:hypothetical protein D3C84_744120 [compost metagenome]
MARENASFSNRSRSRALTTTDPAAPPAACSMRQASSSGKESARAQPTEATANIVSPARITGLRPKLSASGP